MNVMFCVLSLGWMSDVKKGGNHVKIGKEMKFKVSSLTLLLPWVTKTEFLLTISIQYQPDK